MAGDSNLISAFASVRLFVRREFQSDKHSFSVLYIFVD